MRIGVGDRLAGAGAVRAGPRIDAGRRDIKIEAARAAVGSAKREIAAASLTGVKPFDRGPHEAPREEMKARRNWLSPFALSWRNERMIFAEMSMAISKWISYL